MSAKRSVVTGFVIASVVGAGGGLGLQVLAADMRPPATAPSGVVSTTNRVRVEFVNGTVRTMTLAGDWRVTREGDTLARPTAVIAEGLGAAIALSQGDARIVASLDARISLNAPGRPLKLFLDSGRAVARRGGGLIEVSLPGPGVKVSGPAVGAWIREDRTLIAVLDGEAEVEIGGKAQKFAAGREVVIDKNGTTPALLPAHLTLAIESARSRGDRWEVSGTTSPTARLLVKHGAKTEIVPISSTGSFSTWIAGEKPAEGELVAYDSAGRRAEYGKPSPSVAEMLQVLSGEPAAPAEKAEKAPVAEKAAEKAEPAGEAPAPAPAGEAPATEAKAAPEKPEKAPAADTAKAERAAAEKAEKGAATEQAKAEKAAAAEQAKAEKAAAAEKAKAEKAAAQEAAKAAAAEKAKAAADAKLAAKAKAAEKAAAAKKPKAGGVENANREGRFEIELPTSTPPGDTRPSKPEEKKPEVRKAEAKKGEKKADEGDTIKLDWE